MSALPRRGKLGDIAINEEEVSTMSTPSIATPAVAVRAGHAEEVDRDVQVRQYSLAQIFAVWAAAALPMAVLAWIVAPALKDSFTGAGNVPMRRRCSSLSLSA